MTTPAVEQAPVQAEDYASQRAHAIASVGTPSDPSPAPSASPEGNAPPKAAAQTTTEAAAPATAAATTTEQQPAEAPPVAGQPEATPSTATATPSTQPPKPDTQKPEDAAKAESERRLRLGLPPLEAESVETLKRQRTESTREAQRLVAEKKAIEALFADHGVSLVRKEDGTFGLVAEQKYLEKIKGDRLPDVFAQLTDEQRDMVDEDVAKEIVKRTVAAMNAQRPPITATRNDSTEELPEPVVAETFSELGKSKLPNGEPIYPDIDKAEVMNAMRQVYDDPSMRPFRNWANQSKENFRTALNLLHGVVFRSEAPRMAVLKDQQEQLRLKEQANNHKPSTLPRTGTTPQIQGQLTAQQIAAKRARDIAAVG